MYLPLPLVPREGLYQIHWQSLNTHRGKHRSGGAQKGGGSNLRKIGAGENFEVSGVPKLNPFLQRFSIYIYIYIENPQFGGQKSNRNKLSKDNLRGEFPTLFSSVRCVRYVLTPPIPVSDRRADTQTPTRPTAFLARTLTRKRFPHFTWIT